MHPSFFCFENSNVCLHCLQLLKGQAEAKQQGKVPPTKIAIQLPQSISNVALTTPANPVKVTAPTVLFPGQQLVQMPDGKLQIFSQLNAPQQQQQQPQPPLPQHPISSSSANMNSVAAEVPSVVNYLKRFTEVINKEPQFENKSPKRAKMNLMEKPKERNDSKNEDMLSLTGNNEVKDNLMKEYDKKFETVRLEIENLKKENENQNLKLQIEILLLKKEVIELREKLNAKMTTDETKNNLNFFHETVINPSEFQQETVMNTEITIKEEPIQ